jgi:hypothetical protein
MKTEKLTKEFYEYEKRVIEKLAQMNDEIGPKATSQMQGIGLHEKEIWFYIKGKKRMKADKLFRVGKALKC